MRRKIRWWWFSLVSRFKYHVLDMHWLKCDACYCKEQVKRDDYNAATVFWLCSKCIQDPKERIWRQANKESAVLTERIDVTPLGRSWWKV